MLPAATTTEDLLLLLMLVTGSEAPVIVGVAAAAAIVGTAAVGTVEAVGLLIGKTWRGRAREHAPGVVGVVAGYRVRFWMESVDMIVGIDTAVNGIGTGIGIGIVGERGSEVVQVARMSVMLGVKTRLAGCTVFVSSV